MAVIFYQWLFLSSLFFGGLSSRGEIKSESTSSAYHPFYVSVMEMEHNATEKTLEISCKVFAEDLEAIIKKNYKTVVSLTEEKDKANLEKLIPHYFDRHLTIVVDGKPVRLSFIGFEKDKESAFCYFQVEGIASAKKVDISNTILFDFIDQQINIMHVTVGGKRQSQKLNYPDRTASFSF